MQEKVCSFVTSSDSRSGNKNSLPLQTKNAIWLGWRDSNPRMTGPEPVALPLGDTPSLQNTVAQAGVVFKLFAPKLSALSYCPLTLFLVVYSLIALAGSGIESVTLAGVINQDGRCVI